MIVAGFVNEKGKLYYLVLGLLLVYHAQPFWSEAFTLTANLEDAARSTIIHLNNTPDIEGSSRAEEACSNLTLYSKWAVTHRVFQSFRHIQQRHDRRSAP